MIDTLKYALKTYLIANGINKKKYAEQIGIPASRVYKWLNYDADIMVCSFEQMMQPLGYFFADQGAEVKKVYNNLGWKKTLVMTGRQTAFVEKVIEGRKNVSLKKYVELIEGFGLELKIRNNITEPLFAKYLTCPPYAKSKYVKMIEDLEEQGIVDFNNQI